MAKRHTHRVKSVWGNRMSIFGSNQMPKAYNTGTQRGKSLKVCNCDKKYQLGYFDEGLKVQNHSKNISLVYFDDQTRGCRPPALSPCVKR